MPPKVTVGSLIDKMVTVRDKRRELTKQDDILKAEYEELEKQLLDAMDKQELPKAAGKLASAGISLNTVYTVKDWDAFQTYVYKHKAAHLFQRRITNAAVDELFKLSPKGVPGVEPFVKRGINLRAL